jgi:hypothetical protein
MVGRRQQIPLMAKLDTLNFSTQAFRRRQWIAGRPQPYTDSFRFTVSAPPWSSLLEVAYVGNRVRSASTGPAITSTWFPSTAPAGMVGGSQQSHGGQLPSALGLFVLATQQRLCRQCLRAKHRGQYRNNMNYAFGEAVIVNPALAKLTLRRQPYTHFNAAYSIGWQSPGLRSRRLRQRLATLRHYAVPTAPTSTPGQELRHESNAKTPELHLTSAMWHLGTPTFS